MSYTLTYYPIRGRAEAIRIIAAEANVTVKNKFLDGQSFGALKPTLPFGQVPFLESDDGTLQLAQSMTIARYIAKKGNLVPSNLEHAALADMYVDGVYDAVNAFASAYYSPEKETKLKEFVEQKLPFFLGKFDGFLKNSGDFLVGGKITWADLVLFDFLETTESMNNLESFPHLKSFKAAIAARPRIKAYVESPDRPKPFSG